MNLTSSGVDSVANISVALLRLCESSASLRETRPYVRFAQRRRGLAKAQGKTQRRNTGCRGATAPPPYFAGAGVAVDETMPDASACIRSKAS